ncbi:MAG TPA: outer membrane protein transport protein [Polyangiaceae bacterium]|nr:outer membrane protein transport protein [Polyangiaceae bacterium]
MRAQLRALAVVGAGVFAAQTAQASNVTEFPDNGSEQMGRGGAWLARASDPLAAFYNPAGLAGQDTKVTVQINLPFLQTCFARVQASNDTTPDPLVTNGAFPKVCGDVGTFPTPSIGFNYRVSRRVGLGFLFTAPNGAAASAWPEFVTDSTGKLQAAPERYLLTYSSALFVTPTIAVGWEPVDNLRFGASFEWGIASAQFSNASAALNQDGLPPRANDVKASLSASTIFVPGFTLGALWSAAPTIDVAAWYKWSAPIDASGDVQTYANYYDTGANVIKGNTALPDCVDGTGADKGCKPGLAHLKLPVPMEAKIGFRLHKPRKGLDEAVTSHRRDPLSQDVWDVETDFTWANDSAIDNLEVRFPSNPDGTGHIPVNGTGGTLPPNADVPHHFNDVFGVRLGGDYNAIPDRLALRVGGFFESQAADARYQNIDFASGARVGLALGGTLRIPTKRDASPEKGGLIEISLGYMHVFVTDLTNNDPNAPGLSGLAGTPCNGGTFTGGSATAVGTCGTATTPYRTNWAVNLGTISNALDVVNVGASYRF